MKCGGCDTLHRSLAERSYLSPKVRGGGRDKQPHVQGGVAARAQKGREELLHVQGQEGWLCGDSPRPRKGTEVCNIVQEAVINTIPKKKKCKLEKWLSEEALQIVEGRREAKDKGKRYTQLNAEFQKIARRDKKAFLSDQCKEIEENNRMGKN